mmetsp:Transcript_71493/g.115358  ORF Transcript_71493/g.115358 Transcript_71493/m.115358 type:complete len:128 (-) Transcript_71493:1234-1617(-)
MMTAIKIGKKLKPGKQSVPDPYAAGHWNPTERADFATADSASDPLGAGLTNTSVATGYECVRLWQVLAYYARDVLTLTVITRCCAQPLSWSHPFAAGGSSRSSCAVVSTTFDFVRKKNCKNCLSCIN